MDESRIGIPEELVNNMMGDNTIRGWLPESDDNHEVMVRRIALAGLSLLEFLRSAAALPPSNEFFRAIDWQSFHPSTKGAAIRKDEQVPFYVLKKILEWANRADVERQADTDLDSILKHAWLKLSPFQYDSPIVIAGVPLRDNSHLLEFLYDNIIGSSDSENIIGSSDSEHADPRRVRHITLPRADQLKGKGVKFARNEGLLKKIRFDPRNLTLYLPAIEMDSGTKAVLRNLVLFEASRGNESQPLMSYVNLMARLIEKAEDVERLQDVGIIQSHLGTNDVANVWNGMREQLPTNNIKYEPIDNAIYGVKSFYTSKCRSFYEIYRRYFSTPWSAISFFVACISFGVAAFQTYLAWEQVRLQRESMPKT